MERGMSCEKRVVVRKLGDSSGIGGVDGKIGKLLGWLEELL